MLKQADQTVAEIERFGRRMNRIDAVISARNHYNKRLNRCFVLVREHSLLFGLTNEIYDAVEHSILVSCGSTGKNGAESCLDLEGNESESISSDEADKRIRAFMTN